MKRVTCGLLVLLFVICSLKGQDKIVTIQGDTIEGRIVSMPRKSSKPLNPWMIGVQAGGSHLTVSTADAENRLASVGVSKAQSKDYCKKLKNGFHFSGNVYYLIRDFFGAGVKYSFFTSSAGIDFMLKDNSYIPQFYPVGIKEKLYVNYVGPSVIFRQWLDEKHTFRITEELSGGYVHYRDELKFDQNQYPLGLNSLATGSNWGGNFALSIEYYLFPALSIGANGGFFYSKIKKLDYSTVESSQTVNLDKNYYENPSRLDYSLGIRYHF